MSLAGCTASKPSATTKSTNSARLAKNQIRAYYRYPNASQYSVLLFSQDASVATLIKGLDFNPPLSLPQKQRLMELLYANIPQGVHQGPFGDIAVGEYFDDGSPLLFRLGIFTPQAAFEPPTDNIVILQSNVMWDPGKQTTVKSAGRFVSLEKNYSKVYVLFPDGRLVDQEDLYNEDPEKTLQ